jgi:hypothetical protein
VRRYKIRIEGRGIEAATQKGPPLRGFFVTRVVVAASAAEARALALATVERDWREGRYAGLKQTPVCEVIETATAGYFAWITVNTEYIFHRGI